MGPHLPIWLFSVSARSKVTNILSMTTHIRIGVSHVLLDTTVEGGGGGPRCKVSVHLFPEEIDTTKANVNGVDGLLHVQVPNRLIEIPA